jgi:hypothetical protein
MCSWLQLTFSFQFLLHVFITLPAAGTHIIGVLRLQWSEAVAVASHHSVTDLCPVLSFQSSDHATSAVPLLPVLITCDKQQKQTRNPWFKACVLNTKFASLVVFRGRFYCLKDNAGIDTLWVWFWEVTKEQREVMHVAWGMRYSDSYIIVKSTDCRDKFIRILWRQESRYISSEGWRLVGQRNLHPHLILKCRWHVVRWSAAYKMNISNLHLHEL